MDVDTDFHVPFHCRQLAPSDVPGWDYSTVPELVILPEDMLPEDARALTEHLQMIQSAAATISSSSSPSEVEQFERQLRQLALAWENYYLPKYPGPFFRVRVADVRAAGGSWNTALILYDEALHSLHSPEAASFAEFVSTVRIRAQDDAEQQVVLKNRHLKFFQPWKPARQHANPFSWPMLPAAAQDMLSAWQTSTTQRQYLNYNWVQTIQLDQDCLLTTRSTEALTKFGFQSSLVEFTQDSELRDPEVVVQALHDIDCAYNDILKMQERVELLTTENLKAVHAKLMRTLKVQIVENNVHRGRTNLNSNSNCNNGGAIHYVNAGCTRQTTQKTALVRNNHYNLAFCPVEFVDHQLDYICKMGRQYIARWRNPFATAAWLHVTFTRCHPFDDANGRMARLVSSIPLLRFGFPPLCITPNGRRVYYDSMNIAWEGDYQPMIDCFVNCIRDAMTDVDRVMG